jgi:hypothetical protein
MDQAGQGVGVDFMFRWSSGHVRVQHYCGMLKVGDIPTATSFVRHEAMMLKRIQVNFT